jgi:hypothetical protein
MEIQHTVRHKLYTYKHFGQYTLGEVIDEILKEDKETYTLRVSEYETAFNFWNAGKSPSDIADLIIAQRAGYHDKTELFVDCPKCDNWLALDVPQPRHNAEGNGFNFEFDNTEHGGSFTCQDCGALANQEYVTSSKE